MRIFRKGHSQRGSALVVVILVTLLLSALSIVAMRNVARSAQQASVFHTRNQSQNSSSAAVNLYAARAGDNAAQIVKGIKEKGFGQAGGTSNVFSGTANEADRLATATAGGYLKRSDDDLVGLLPESTSLTSTSREQTGLFTNSALNNRSFEDGRSGRFEVIVRDLVDGIPAVGFGEQFCFKKAFIASESRVGISTDDFGGINNVAYSRHGKEVLMGPIDCGS